MNWLKKHPGATLYHLGFIPDFLNEADARPAKQQFATSYAHGGGWSAFDGFNMREDGSIVYPGDPPLPVLWEGQFREELVRVYQHAWVAVVQPNGDYEICRMD